MLAWHEPEISHELPRAIEPAHIAHFGDYAGCNDECNAAKSLRCLHDRAKRPAWQECQYLPFDGFFALDGLIHCIDVGLEGDLLCRMGEALIAEPNAMLLLPDCSDISTIMAQQEAPNALSGLADILGRNFTSPD